MAAAVIVSLVILFFATCTLLLVVLVIRAPLIEEYDDVPQAQSPSAKAERVPSPHSPSRRQIRSRQVVVETRGIFAPQAQEVSRSSGHANLPR